ncbi:MAG: ATP-binding protein [Comamonadaceae bacterium]|nr:ATP-binding protein [Comamonadaceae bacterium]
MRRRKLPIGLQTFRQIIEEGYYYVDKTGLALDLIEAGKYYFLSRPRRFGKSLLLDTIKDLFEGHQDLFKGLAAETRWDWGRKFPVIHLSFGEGVLHSREALAQRIGEILNEQQIRLGVQCQNQSIAGIFSELIQAARAKTDQRVVVLVDEYDKPILDNITDAAIARDMRDGLRDLYSVIKGQDANIQFAMLTGVSKFSKVSLFSGLNNLKDITLDARYSALCGYTDKDVDTVFAAELPGLDRDKIREWYNGYNWLGTSVYNPFDALLLFDTREFRAHWFETGTPTFLVDVLMARHTFTPDLARLVASESLLSTFDVDSMPVEALLFQAGYLTIDKVRRLPGMTQYTLRFPNLEVRSSLNGALLERMSHDPARQSDLAPRLYDLLLDNDFAGIQTLITAFFESIPNQWFTNNPIAQYEGYYASVFYSYFAALGLDITCEKSSNAGRLDMALRFNAQVYLFEFKVVELVPDGRALQQIKDKGYAKPYLGLGQPIHLIGVAFSKTSRSVVGFELETLFL